MHFILLFFFLLQMFIPDPSFFPFKLVVTCVFVQN